MAAAIRAPISFGFQSRPGRAGPDGSCRIINAYAEEAGEEGKSKLQLHATEGLLPFADVGNMPVRGAFAVADILYVIAGSGVFTVSTTGVATRIGDAPDTGAVTMARNRRETNPQVAFTAGGDAFLIEGTVVKQVSDEDLPPINSVCFIDGYFVYGIDDQSAGKFFLSGIDAGDTINALDFATAESDPDRIVRVFKRKGELWLMGETTIEVWSNNGDVLFPFVRLPGVAIDHGCLAPLSVQLLEEMVIWLATDGTVRAAKGYAAERISHHAVERSITAETDKTAIGSMTISHAGHSLYVLAGKRFTWVYDYTTKLWHERESYRRPRWRAEVSCTFDGRTIVGCYDSGKLLAIDDGYYEEDGEPQVMLLRGPLQHSFPDRLQFFDLRIDVVSGVGAYSGDNDATDPHAMLRYSDDGGRSWSDERRGSIGKWGDGQRQLRFGPMGQTTAAGRTIEFRLSAAVARTFISANAKIRAVKAR